MWARARAELRRCGSGLLLVFVVTSRALAAEPQLCEEAPCPGDCGLDGSVTIDELLRGVNVLLGLVALEECPAFDADANGVPSLEELVTAVRRLLQGCDASQRDRTPESLVDHLAWTEVPAGEDPWIAMRPQGAACASGAFRFEIIAGEESLEVKTEECSYLTVGQPTRTAVRRGEELYLRLWHFQLTAPERGLVYMAVAFGDCVIWEQRRRIPSPSALLTARIPAPFAIPQGTRVAFHVQNHGANSYHLIEVSVGGSLLDE